MNVSERTPSWTTLLVETCTETPVVQLLQALGRADPTGQMVTETLRSMLGAVPLQDPAQAPVLVRLLALIKQLPPTENFAALVAEAFFTPGVHAAARRRAEMLFQALVKQLIASAHKSGGPADVQALKGRLTQVVASNGKGLCMCKRTVLISYGLMLLTILFFRRSSLARHCPKGIAIVPSGYVGFAAAAPGADAFGAESRRLARRFCGRKMLQQRSAEPDGATGAGPGAGVAA